LEQRLRQGTIGDYATLAQLGHVSRARITQIMNLLLLAPDIRHREFKPISIERFRAKDFKSIASSSAARARRRRGKWCLAPAS
jgi:hypothetical protein